MYNKGNFRERGDTISEIHAGHRKRLKEEFEKHGLAHFPEHKVLEMLLFYSIPRKDTNELAHHLLKQFGTFSGVFHAPYDLLLETEGVGRETALFIKFIAELIHVYLEDLSANHQQITTREQAKEHVAHRFLGKTAEEVRVVCLAMDGHILYEGVLVEGTPERVGAKPLEILRLALRVNAVRVLLAHNHPHGISTPSLADFAATTVLYHELERVEVELFDHIIVGKDGVCSMVENGMFPEEFYQR